MLRATGSASALLSMKSAPAQPQVKQLRNLGGAPAGFPVRSRAARQGGQPFDFIGHCHNLGLGVVETRLQSTDAQGVKNLRQRLENYNMRAVADIPLPRDESELPARPFASAT